MGASRFDGERWFNIGHLNPNEPWDVLADDSTYPVTRLSGVPLDFARSLAPEQRRRQVVHE